MSDASEQVVLNRDQVKGLLPHRGWALLIRDAVVVPGVRITARWWVSPWHPMLWGHFWRNRIFMGFLVAEMASQTAGLCALLTQGGTGGKATVLQRADGLAWRYPARPGNTLIARMVITKLTKKQLVATGEVWVDDGSVCRLACEIGEVSFLLTGKAETNSDEGWLKRGIGWLLAKILR